MAVVACVRVSLWVALAACVCLGVHGVSVVADVCPGLRFGQRARGAAGAHAPSGAALPPIIRHDSVAAR